MKVRRLPLILAGILTVAGAGLFVAARPAHPDEPDPLHWLTEDLRRDAATHDDTAGPTFAVVDTEGDMVDLAKLTRGRPVFIVFIKDSCPCSYAAQPFFQRLYDGFDQKVPFIGITDGTEAQGREWKAHFQQTFPMIADPKVDLMRKFGAKHSAYTALIGKGGRVVRLWPGYDRQMLGEMIDTIAREAGVATPRIDISDAPRKPTTGCAF